MTRPMTLGLLTLGLIAALTFSFSTPQVLRAESEHDHHGEHEVLEKNMKVMGSAYRQLRRDARDKKFNESSLKEIERMLKSTVLAMYANGEEHITKKEDVIVYRTYMSEMIKLLLDTELAILNDKNEEAAKTIGELGSVMKKAHNKFKKD